MSTLLVRAPAKINLTFEVLGRRPDGYHEVRTVLLTLDLADLVLLSRADRLSLVMEGAAGALAGEPPDQNLAFRAAAALRNEAGCQQGALIRLQKRVPIAAGFGGGSSDAAAVLRGLNVLWGLSLPVERLASVAAGLGSDVPFFLHCGAALASGRGEHVTPLPDPPSLRLLLLAPRGPARVAKTASMYAQLAPGDYTSGAASERLAARIRRGLPVRDRDIVNAFEAALPTAAPTTSAAMDALRALGHVPHLAGAGPSFFLLLGPDDDDARFVARASSAGGWTATIARSLSRQAALAMEVPS